jgi:hypothetical protein
MDMSSWAASSILKIHQDFSARADKPHYFAIRTPQTYIGPLDSFEGVMRLPVTREHCQPHAQVYRSVDSTDDNCAPSEAVPFLFGFAMRFFAASVLVYYALWNEDANCLTTIALILAFALYTYGFVLALDAVFVWHWMPRPVDFCCFVV